MLDENLTLLQSIVDGLPTPTVVIDLEYQTILSNQAALDSWFNPCKMPTYSPSHNNFHKLEISNKEHASFKLVERVRQSGQSVTVTWKQHQPNGEESFIEIQAAPLWGNGGKLEGILQSWHDITQQGQAKQAQDKIHFALEVLRSMTEIGSWDLDAETFLKDVVKCMVKVMDADAGAIFLLEANEGDLQMATAYGISKEELVDFPLQTGKEFIGHIVQQGISQTILNDSEVTPNNGIKSILGVPLKTQNQVLGMAYIFSSTERVFDLSEIYRFEMIADRVAMTIENKHLSQEAATNKLLRQLDKMRSELLANVSHEIRTPLGLIKLLVTTLLRDDVTFDKDTLREFLDDIDAETDKLDSIVKNLLNLSPTGNSRLVTLPTDISMLAHNVLEGARRQHPDYKLFLDFPAHPLVVEIDAKSIEQVLRNLIDNAIKYSPEGSSITLLGTKDKNSERDQILLSVSDQGVGIPENELTKIFSRFYRVDHPAVHRAGGVGLGLAVCQKIVQNHEGRIWAKSKLGEGTTFFFTLPITKQGVQ
jgi:K+-sensing histidine kinase KdpD